MKPKLENILLFLVLLTDVNRTVLSFDSKCPPLKLVNGRIRYRLRGRSVRFSCIKGFQLVGEKYATCMNGDWDTNAPICVKYGCRAPISTHINGQFIESYRGAVVKIVCNPGYTLDGSPSVYCNGYRWNETFPVCRVTNTNPALSCDFESDDLCGWSQDPMHDFDWKRQNRSIPSGDNATNLLLDNTKKTNTSGYYMHMESSNPRIENDTARLYSPVYPAQYPNGTCFKFWYYINAPATWILKVYVKPEGVEFFDLIPSLWINGEQENFWNLGFFHIDPSESPFQIVIEGVRGPGAVGDIAFDDVTLTSRDECRALEMTSSTEISTSVNPEDDAIDLFSCQNRCNETKPLGDNSTCFDTCCCHETCDRDGTCCVNYFEICSTFPSTSTSPSTSQQTETTSPTEASSSKTTPTPPTTRPKVQILNPILKHFPNYNNESNEINPNKPILTNPTENKPNRSLNEIPRNESTTTTRTTSKTTPKSKPPSPPNATLPKDIPKFNVPKIPEINLTPNEIPRRGNQPKTIPEVKNSTVTSSPATTVTRTLKNPMPNNIKLTFLEKGSGSPNGNEPWSHNAKSKESGKDSPQAIKIDKKDESEGNTLRGMIEIGGSLLAVLVIIIFGVALYRRRENRKLERENMVEDSDSIVYNSETSTLGSESHSLVGIRPGALRPSQDPNLFK